MKMGKTLIHPFIYLLNHDCIYRNVYIKEFGYVQTKTFVYLSTHRINHAYKFKCTKCICLISTQTQPRRKLKSSNQLEEDENKATIRKWPAHYNIQKLINAFTDLMALLIMHHQWPRSTSKAQTPKMSREGKSQANSHRAWKSSKITRNALRRIQRNCRRTASSVEGSHKMYKNSATACNSINLHSEL